MNALVLQGCRVQPLAAYLKALGIFRLVSSQVDREAQLAWNDDHAVLTTRMQADELVRWFLQDYQPTPITSPWNGGSGYFPNDKSARKALDQIESDPHPRFESYRRTLVECRAALAKLGLKDKPDPKVAKPRLMRMLRSTLSAPAALEWLDAACVLRDDDRIEMVPLLGTGGNDGRLDFSSNYAQNLVNLLLAPAKKRPAMEALLRQALFDEPCQGLENTAIGQYAPGVAGGPNTTSGFDGAPNVNPWDFVLALEGSLVFSAAATRRLGDDSQGFSLPFTVDPSMGGHSAISSDEENNARCEMWLPTWSQPIQWSELRAVFAEGRAQVGGRQAASGVDFARAVASLGTERGFDGFERYTFLVRNGKSYFASPAGRYRPQAGSKQREIDLLVDLDPWMRSFRRKAENHGGAVIRKLFRQYDDAVFELCRRPDSEGSVRILRVLGAIQRQLAQMPKLHQRSQPECFVAPIPPLRADWWPDRIDSVELRLAMGLRGLEQIRQFVLPIENNQWADESRDAVWTRGSLTSNLIRVLKRRFFYTPSRKGQPLTETAIQRWRFGSKADRAVRPHDLECFLYGRTHDEWMESYFHALLLVEPPDPKGQASVRSSPCTLPQGFAQLKVCHSAFDPRPDPDLDWLCPRTIIDRLSAGDLDGGLRECDRFLLSKGCPPLSKGAVSCLDPPRLAAALAFPVAYGPFRRLCEQVFPPHLEVENKEHVHVD